MIETTVVRNESEKESEYPCMKISITNGLLVYFKKRGRGAVMSDSSTHELLSYSSEWCMDCFEPFYGKVIFESKP